MILVPLVLIGTVVGVVVALVGDSGSSPPPPPFVPTLAPTSLPPSPAPPSLKRVFTEFVVITNALHIRWHTWWGRACRHRWWGRACDTDGGAGLGGNDVGARVGTNVAGCIRIAHQSDDTPTTVPMRTKGTRIETFLGDNDFFLIIIIKTSWYIPYVFDFPKIGLGKSKFKQYAPGFGGMRAKSQVF